MKNGFVTYEEILKNYYGSNGNKRTKSKKKNNTRAKTVMFSKVFDNGDNLIQKIIPPSSFKEYVVQSSLTDKQVFEEYVVQSSVPVDEVFEEYVVRSSIQESSTAKSFMSSLPNRNNSPSEEYNFDLMGSASANKNNVGNELHKSCTPTNTTFRRENTNFQNTGNAGNEQPKTSQQTSTDSDFEQDFKDILQGKKLYDQASKKVIDRNQTATQQSLQPSQPSPSTAAQPPVKEFTNEHLIFDEIAKKMKYATAYDLGTVEIDKRFNDFDKIAELQKRANAAKAVRSSEMTTGTPVTKVIYKEPEVNTVDFIKDLDAIKKGACAQSWVQEYTSPLTVTRGIRNNNPGNIQINERNNWDSKVPVSQNTDGRFEQFTSYAYGVRALIILIRNYIRGGRDTVRKIAEVYAPSQENDTIAYSRFLAGRLNVDEQASLSLTRNILRLLIQSIGRMENGQECISDQQFDEGWTLLPDQIRSETQSTIYTANISHVFDDTTISDVAADILRQTERVEIPAAIRTQLEQIRQNKSYTLGGNTFVPSLSILNTIKAVLNFSLAQTSNNPAFGILSYIRPASSHHSNGTAVDLSIINGHRIDIRDQQEALSGIAACIRNLAPGNYALGMPRPPRIDPQGAQTDKERYRHLNLYDANTPPGLLPQYQSLPQTYFFLGPEWNERYVPGGINGGLSHINNQAARTELENAINESAQRGAYVQYLMADALDHLHIQVI